MTKLAQDVTVDESARECAITIDGEPFPWYVTAEDIDVVLGGRDAGWNTITLTIPFTGNLRKWSGKPEAAPAEP